MTFEGEVSWTVTAKVRVKAENKADAILRVLKNPAVYVVIPDNSATPTAINEGSVKVNLKQVQ